MCKYKYIALLMIGAWLTNVGFGNVMAAAENVALNKPAEQSSTSNIGGN